jgi:hypothetical protein
MRNLPTAAGAQCRDAIAKAVNSYATGTIGALSACHDAIVEGQLPAATDCNSVSASSSVIAKMMELAPIVDKAVETCASTTRTPPQMGFDSCPTPCNGTVITGWWDVANCLRCQVQAAAMNAAETVYGPPRLTPPMLPASETCQDVVGHFLKSVVGVRTRETAKCQTKVDGGTPLPAGVMSCSVNDPKLHVSKAEEEAASFISRFCDDAGALSELDLCGGAAEAATVEECVLDATRTFSDSVFDAAIRTGGTCLLCDDPTPVTCGDNVTEFPEQCDGTSDAACPNLCQYDCACEISLCAGVSPNGLLQMGEECDDGNLNPCDLCTNGCHIGTGCP